TQHMPRGRDTLQNIRPSRVIPYGGSATEKLHADREQLYEAIREAMTQAGILSASYKFKVLSLDRQGKGFMVMVDLTKTAGDTVNQPSEMEAVIVQNAKNRYNIMVHAVYWRLNEVMASSKPSPLAAIASVRVTPAVKKEELSHEPIQADEVLAFQQALFAASAQGSAAVIDKNVQVRSGLRFSRPPPDFLDTEVAESKSNFYPALSSTQYGDLH
ncbi:MAG: hypothetical protein JWP96_1081, partial [Polaromonas sp.]|nr:hypothetical protein [Polaromonas sp.]